MNTTQEHDTWFREIGQFLEPAGSISDPQTLEMLKQYSQSARDDLRHECKSELDAAVAQEKEEGEEDAKESMKTFKKDLFRICNEDGTDAEILAKILKEVT